MEFVVLNEEDIYVENEKLDLHARNIEDLNDVKGLESMESLEILNLCCNPIERIPDWFDNLSLKSLYLLRNDLEEMPNIIYQMRNLEILIMDYVKGAPKNFNNLKLRTIIPYIYTTDAHNPYYHYMLLIKDLHSLQGDIGCSIKQINQIEDRFQIKLPEAYKQYLKVFGNKDYYYLLEMNDDFEEIIKYNVPGFKKERLYGLIREGIEIDDFFIIGINGSNTIFLDLAEKEENPILNAYLEGEDSYGHEYRLTTLLDNIYFDYVLD